MNLSDMMEKKRTRESGFHGPGPGFIPPSPPEDSRREPSSPLEELRYYLLALVPGWPPKAVEVLRIVLLAVMTVMTLLHGPGYLIFFFLLVPIMCFDYFLSTREGLFLDTFLFTIVPFLSYPLVELHWGREASATFLVGYIGLVAVMTFFCPSIRSIAGMKSSRYT